MKKINILVILITVLLVGCTKYNLSGWENRPGNITTDSNVSLTLHYGEMWNYTSSGYVFSIDNPETYYNISGLISGNLNGFKFNNQAATEGTYLTAEIDGLYRIVAHMSAAGTVNGLYGFGIAKNGIIQRNCYGRRTVTTTDTDTSAVACLMELTSGDTVVLQIEDERNPSGDITIYTVNLNLVRIGDI